MNEYETLSRTTWDCKYHAVFIPKYRRKSLHLELRCHFGQVFYKLAILKEGKIEEGYLKHDHAHMMLSIRPKYAVSQVVGFIKSKSAVRVARAYGERRRNFVGQRFWARKLFVNTDRRDEVAIRTYIRNQEKKRGREAALSGSFLWCRVSALYLTAAPADSYYKAPGVAGGC